MKKQGETWQNSKRAYLRPLLVNPFLSFSFSVKSFWPELSWVEGKVHGNPQNPLVVTIENGVLR